MITTSEWIMLAAGVVMGISLPLLANGSFALWLIAQGIYFVGVIVMVIHYFRGQHV